MLSILFVLSILSFLSFVSYLSYLSNLFDISCLSDLFNNLIYCSVLYHYQYCQYSKILSLKSIFSTLSTLSILCVPSEFIIGTCEIELWPFSMCSPAQDLYHDSIPSCKDPAWFNWWPGVGVFNTSQKPSRIVESWRCMNESKTEWMAQWTNESTNE